MKKKFWNWFPRKDGNLIVNSKKIIKHGIEIGNEGKRYSLLETDPNGNLLSAIAIETNWGMNKATTEFETSGILEYIEPKLSWWQRIIASIRELINMIWGKI